MTNALVSQCRPVPANLFQKCTLRCSLKFFSVKYFISFEVTLYQFHDSRRNIYVFVFKEITSKLIQQVTETRKIQLSPVDGCSDLKETVYHEKENKYKLKPKLIIEPLQALHQQPFPSYSNEKTQSSQYLDMKQKSIVNEELLHNLKQNAKLAMNQKRVIENLVQVHVENPSSVSDSFRYQERFMKQAITGIF